MHEDVIQALGGRDAPALSSPIDEHLRALADQPDLPDLAVAVCTLRASEAAPTLLAVLARAADGAILNQAESTLLFRGLHILGAARETAAWPLLVRFLRRPIDELDFHLGDALTENLSKIAAGIFDGDPDSLFDLALDHDVYEFVREAMFGTATFLTLDGRIERSRMQDFLLRFWKQPAEDYDYAWVGWLEAIALLDLRDLVPLVHQAFDEKRIDELLYGRKDFERELARTMALPDDAGWMGKADLGYIDDVLEALDKFSSSEPGGYEDEVLDAFEPPQEPVRNLWRNVGRNDPCPCGSGKKAKKCCLPAQG